MTSTTKTIDKANNTDYLSKSSCSNIKGTRTILISTNIAARWLEWNIINRPVRENHVERLSARMGNGEWMLNGQCIVMSSEGILLDGQHRLLALIKHGKPVLFDVRFGIDENAFNVIDDGMKRSPADVFSINDIPYATQSSSICRSIIKHNQGDTRGDGGVKRPSNLEVLEFYKSCDTIEHIVKKSMTWYSLSDRLLSVREFGLLYYLFRKSDPLRAIGFFQSIADGIGLDRKDPVYHVRRRLTINRMQKTSTIKKGAKFRMIVKAWNLFIQGKKVQRLKWNKEGKIEIL